MHTPPFDYQPYSPSSSTSAIGTKLAYSAILLYLLHYILRYFTLPVLESPSELVWNALVYVLPRRLLLDRQQREQRMISSHAHAAKSEALRKMLGMGGQSILQNMPAGGAAVMRRASNAVFSRQQPPSDAPAGLGNWDNSCYQNSVLQGLASLESLKPYLLESQGQIGEGNESTTETLLETIKKLNDPANNGRQLWTPAKLKSMSSWQQQDAQEYYSKIMDELEKESAKSLSAAKAKPGLESITSFSPATSDDEQEDSSTPRNPLDGLLAQAVTCTRCGHSDGLSMIPFNCLTLPLGNNPIYAIEDCLDDYTKAEDISDVECAKCTLLNAEKQMLQMLPQPPQYMNVDEVSSAEVGDVMKLPPELRAQAFVKLAAVQNALSTDDFSDQTLTALCKKSRVSSTKTRQAVVGRAPGALVMHVNRSVFDEMTGAQRKNYAKVRYPMTLDLGGWMLNESGDDKGSGEQREVRYRLRAAVTHYGRHENGHYICYRRHGVNHPQPGSKDVKDAKIDDDVDDEVAIVEDNGEERWWRLSDEDVSSISEEDVLNQGGVFMLFYERDFEHEKPLLPAEEAPDTAAMKLTVEVALESSADQHEATSPLETTYLASEETTPLPLQSIPGTTTSEDEDMTDTTSSQIGLPSTDSTTEDDMTDSSSPQLEPPSIGFTTEDEAEAESRSSSEPVQKTASPSLMRTHHSPSSGSDSRFDEGRGFRAVAAT